MPQKEDNLGKKCPNLYIISTRDETVSSLFAAKHKTRPEMVKQILGRLIQLTDQFTKALDRAVVTSRDHTFIPHQLKSKSEELAGLLRQLSCSNLGTYARAIINQIEVTLDMSVPAAQASQMHHYQDHQEGVLHLHPRYLFPRNLGASRRFNRGRVLADQVLEDRAPGRGLQTASNDIKRAHSVACLERDCNSSSPGCIRPSSM